MIERCPWAIWRPGPPEKVGFWNGRMIVMNADKRGEVKHSMEGSFDVAMNAVLDPLGVIASWHFSVKKDGLIYQHYDVSACTWHSAEEQNETHVGIEHEGVAGEPLTEAQIANTTALTKWLAETNGFSLYARYPDQIGAWELTEHREVHATACPSDRIPWDDILARLQEPPIEEEEPFLMPAIIENPRTTGFDTYLFEARGVYRKLKDYIEREGEAALGNVSAQAQQVRPEVWDWLVDGKEPQE